jgi:two-component system, OmpR family, response regulator
MVSGKETRVDDTILIVDDSPYIVDGLAALLKRKGYKPLTAYGGDEAIGILASTLPDLILLDIMMEPMDGWETLDHIKANPATSDVPVLMFSAKKITAEEAHDHSLNIEDFVSKPVNPAHLMESIKRVFQRRCDVKLEAIIAKDAGFDPALIEEYSALRKSIEVDQNLLTVLKNASGIQNHSREVPAEDLAAIQKLEDKIACDEKRLKEINEKFSKTATSCQ